MLELTPSRARQLMRRTVNPETREKMWRFLQAAAVERRNARLGVVLRPADFGAHRHDFHQFVVGYRQCLGCELRLPDHGQEAA